MCELDFEYISNHVKEVGKEFCKEHLDELIEIFECEPDEVHYFVCCDIKQNYKVLDVSACAFSCRVHVYSDFDEDGFELASTSYIKSDAYDDNHAVCRKISEDVSIRCYESLVVQSVFLAYQCRQLAHQFNDVGMKTNRSSSKYKPILKNCCHAFD